MKTVLFLCVANSARSQLAEGLARARFGDRAHVLSAGSAPSRVNPFALAVLEARGLPTEGHRSKSVEEIDLATVDVVVTLCADEVCPPRPPGVRHLHWPLPDPAPPGADDVRREEALARFEETAAAIEARLDALVPFL